MLDHDAPAAYKPSIFNSSGQLSIKPKDSTGLEGSNAFEGPEKLLEVWFAPAADALPVGVKTGGLKAVHVETWKEMLELVKCKVISIIESEHIDAYLLSESSMFIFPHKLILKTCGTTTLLLGLSRILHIATTSAGFPQDESYVDNGPIATPYRVFYSRKNFSYPDKQPDPHRCWEKEVEFLDNIFQSGSAYMIGKINGDHWYLYLTKTNTGVIMSGKNDKKINTDRIKKTIISQSIPEFPQSKRSTHDDETLEILMTDLDTESAKQFYLEHAVALVANINSNDDHKPHENKATNKYNINPRSEFSAPFNGIKLNTSSSPETHSFDTKSSCDGLLTPQEEVSYDDLVQGHILGAVVSETCGLLDVYSSSKYPSARVDSHLFSPCGLSANGVIPSVDGSSAHYFTVHVTPEPHCSYASFETNVPARQTGLETIAVVKQVINIFKPFSFSVTLFEARPELSESSHDDNLTADKVTAESHDRKNRDLKMDKISGYQRIDRILHEFDGYDLVFRYYEREAR